MTQTESDVPLKTTSSTPSRTHKKRYLRFILLFLLISLLLPSIFIPPWLATKGIEIISISGVNFNNGLMIEKISVVISQYRLRFTNISVGRFIDNESAISAASWRLFAEKTDIRLPTELEGTLNKQGIRLQYIHLFDTSLNFTDLSSPYIFSAHARRITTAAFHSDGTELRAKQAVNNVDLVLATQPDFTISGMIQQGDFSLFFPNLKTSPHYPLQFSKSNFSIAWRPNSTPLSIHIAKIEPRWKTINEGFKQHVTNASLEMDINRPTKTMMLHADTALLDQPTRLPSFIEQPDNENKSIHLGQTIANLAQLPFKKLKVKKFTYGQLILDAKLVLETPTLQSGKKSKLARFTLKGKALAPNPYNLNVHIKHLNQDDAYFTGLMSGPKGNSLNCKANIRFSQPLPKDLTCTADFKNTKDITERFKFNNIPSAKLIHPIVITAKQLESDEKNVVIDNKVIDAKYQIDISMPKSLPVELNHYAVYVAGLFSNNFTTLNKPHSFKKTKTSMQTVANIELITDGQLRLIARYHQEKFKLTLINKSEIIRLKNKKTQSEITHVFKALTCESKTPQHTLQCHIKGDVKARIAFLSPIENLHLKTFSLRSNLDMQLGSNTAISFLDTQIASERLVYSGHPEFLVSEASNAQLSIDSLLLNYNTVSGLTLTQAKPTDASFSASLYAEKIINNAPISEKKHQQIETKNTPIPTQKYSGKLELSIAEFRLNKPIDKPLKLQSNYQTTISMKQNQQRLPPFSSQGNLSFNPEKLIITGDLTNYKMARLARFTVNSYLKRQKTQIELHRNEVSFSSTNSLKKHFLPHLPIDYDLNQGSVALQANVLIDKGVTSGDISLFANSLSGYYRGFHFANVDSSTTLLFTPQGIKSKFPISIHAELVHLGVLFSNVSMVFELDTAKEKYQLHRVFAEVFGGNISTHNVSINSLTTIENIPIVIHNLHLEQALAHIEHEEVELTGILDGQIPLAIHDGLPVVTNGKLHSRYPGGVLRYLEGSRIDKNVEAAGENSILVVSKILKNYNYDALAIDIDYSKEGKLKASSRFKGRNPQFQNGRPVNLNLNIEDDIPALLKTMNAIDSSQLEGLFLKQLGIDE
ncbi:hypothetical protein C9J12_15505 [Photobacterium frigidiphilum]|uniref:Uncharacterized protein n=1 Tax=Photobacterium frigidiphilum TaxID=264736 RepID=A0A2T3JER2_9GAMM|nr:YdbH domain-containing protein [Photobacterium frigidiphilum]PSU47402.1 hypothetical protein C9J12_15505 [Photobacterium frigidiphilum]